MTNHGIRLRSLGLVCLLTCVLAACAGRAQKVATGPVAAATPTPAKPAPVWPGPPDPKVASMLATLGGDGLMALAVVHPDAWSVLRRQLESTETFSPLFKHLPWLASDDPWPLLQVALQLRSPSSTALPALEEWDRTRPVALAWFGYGFPDLLQRINDAIFERQGLLVHLRMVIPALHGGRLAQTLTSALATLPGEVLAPARFSLLGKGATRIAAAVTPDEESVRLDLVYFRLAGNSEASGLRGLMAKHLNTAVERSTKRDVADPIFALLANGRGLAATLRPHAIARRLFMETPQRIATSLFYTHAREKPRLLAKSLRELLAGYLVFSSDAPEVDEMALAFDFNHDAVTLTRFTPTGIHQMEKLFRPHAEVVATSPDAIFSASLLLPPATADADPLFSSSFRVDSRMELLQVVQAVGSPVWLELLARPTALWQTTRTDKGMSRALGLATVWPRQASLELFDFDDDWASAFRVRARIPKGEAIHPFSVAADWPFGFLTLQAASAHQEQTSDATWITWSNDVLRGARRKLPDFPPELAKDLPGTIAVLRASGPDIALRLDKKNREDQSDNERLIAQLARKMGRVEMKARWHAGWLVSELHFGVTDTSRSQPYLPTLPAPAAVSAPVATPGHVALERAAVRIRDLIRNIGARHPALRLDVLRDDQEEVKTALEPARLEDDTRGEAEALDRMLAELAKSLEERERAEPPRAPQRSHKAKRGR